MSNLTMWDTAFNDQFPPGGQAYAGYVDGGVGDQPNYGWIVRTFPKAHHLSIALDPAHDADCLDIEPGAATPGSAADWFRRQKARGIARPCLYANASTMEADVVPVITAAGIARNSVRLWSAHYGAGEHICGPRSCGLVSIDMDGTQWTDNALGRNLDQSLLLPDFFGIPVPPKPPADWTYGPPQNLQATAGHTSVRLSWDAPAGAPVPPAEYEVFIYRGTHPDRLNLVHHYPRIGASPWQGGSLEQGKTYTAHVVAAGPRGAHVKRDVYASAIFTTG